MPAESKKQVGVNWGQMRLNMESPSKTPKEPWLEFKSIFRWWRAAMAPPPVFCIMLYLSLDTAVSMGQEGGANYLPYALQG